MIDSSSSPTDRGRPGKLATIMRKVSRINEAFETAFLRSSLVVASGLAEMYHLRHILQKLDYPVEVLTVENVGDVVHRFVSGRLRMFILSPVMLAQFQTLLGCMASSIDVVFVGEDDEDGVPPTFAHASIVRV